MRACVLACVAARAATVIIALHCRKSASRCEQRDDGRFGIVVAFDVVSGIVDDVVGEIDSSSRGEKEE